MGMKKKEINYQLLIRRICLIVLDIICIIAASILALLTRFEFDFSQIPKEFLKVIYKYGPFTIVITLIIFSLFRIYSSLWEYAGIEEVFSLIAACLAAAVAKIVIILFTWSVMPRSWYVLDTAPSELLADAPLLGKYVDAALYVIRYDYTKLREIREGVESLALSGIDMLGYVFNGDNSSGGQGYGYGYRRYGNYGSYGSHYGSYGKYGAYGHYGKMEKGSTDKFGRVIKD